MDRVNEIACKLLVAAGEHCDQLVPSEGTVDLAQAALLLDLQLDAAHVELTIAALSRIANLFAELAQQFGACE